MRSLKKIGALLLASLLALSLAACQAGEGAAGEDGSFVALDETAATPTPEASPAAEEEPGDESVYSAALDENGYFKGARGLDYVTLPDLAALEVPEEVAALSEDDYAAELDSRLSAYTTQENVTDRAVRDGDTVNIDYVGSVDGEEFAGGTTGGNGTTVTIGVTNYIDNFLEQLIGHTPGETFDVVVTFPEDYGVENLNGKEAVFVTTVNYIVEENTPSLTDEFVRENWMESTGWSTAKEAEEGIKRETRVVSIGDYLWSAIQEGAEISQVPDVFYDYQVTVLKAAYQAMADAYGMDLDTLIAENFGEGISTIEDVIRENQDNLETNAKASLVMQALSEEMGLTVSDEDIAGFFKRNMDVDDYSDYQEEYGRPYLALLTREDLAKRKLGEDFLNREA